MQEEVNGRERSATTRRREAAGFPTGKTFQAWNSELSSIPQPTQSALRTLEWVRSGENLVVCGPSGTGKSFFLQALGHTAVERGLRAAWFTLESLGDLVRRSRADASVAKAVGRGCPERRGIWSVALGRMIRVVRVALGAPRAWSGVVAGPSLGGQKRIA